MGLMTGSLVVLDKINSAKQDKDDYFSWISELMKAGETGLRNEDIGHIGAIIFLGLVMIASCRCIMTKKNETKEGNEMDYEWIWSKKETRGDRNSEEKKDEGSTVKRKINEV